LVYFCLQPCNIVVTNMAAVFAKMSRDTIAAGRDRKLGRAHRVRMAPSARIADGGDVIDIDAKAERFHVLSLRMNLFENPLSIFGVSRYPFTRSAFATTGFARNWARMAVRCLRS